MSARFQPDEVVDVLLKGVRVVTGGDPSLEIVYRGGDRELYALYIKADSPNLVVTRVAPAEWPPQPGDVWADSRGGEWWCRPEHTGDDAEAYLQSQKGGVDDPEWVLRQYGPMTLAYRKGLTPAPAAAVDQADEAAPQPRYGRAAVVAGLRQLADLVERTDVPIPDSWDVGMSTGWCYAEHGYRQPTAGEAIERVQAWADVLDVEHRTRRVGNTIHHNVDGRLSGVPVSMSYIEAAATEDIALAEEVAGPVEVAGPATARDFDLGPICPRCESPDPAKHPAMQADGGEVQPCPDPFHAVESDPAALDQLGVAATDPAEMPDAGEDLRTPDEWQQEYTDQQIMDPDGWRGVKGRPWTDPISREEFLRRRAMCTITGRIKTELAVPVVDGDDTTGGEP